jgi:YihY family inner membrane protein
MRALLHRALERLDRFQERRTWLAFPIAVVKKMSNDQGGSLAALIAYYGLLSLFPLLLVFAAILGFVLAGDPSLEAEVLRTTERSFPSLSGYIGKTLAGSDLALGLGLAGALWAGLGVSMATERAMNTIWNISMAERPNLWRSRLRGLAMLAILGTTFLVSTALASLPGQHGLLKVPFDIVGFVGPLGLDLVLYLLAFQVLTNRHLGWRTILPGAALGAVGWTVLQRLGVFYARHEVAHASHLYGSLATVIGILAWIYLGAQLTLYAAEVNVVLAEHLWPRSLFGMRTAADRRALVRQAQQARRGLGEEIMVTFDDTPE